MNRIVHSRQAGGLTLNPSVPLDRVLFKYDAYAILGVELARVAIRT